MRQNSIYKIPAAFTPDCSSEEIRKRATELLLSQAGYQKMSPINGCYECYFSFLGIDIDTCERSKLEKTIFKDNEARLTQETVERILDKYPTFFSGLNLHIVNKEQEESWIKSQMANNINYYKNLMPMESLLCP